MASNLAQAGFDVVGYNRTRRKAENLIAKGVRPVATIADAVRGADVVITMLPDTPDVEAVALGDDGIFVNAKENLLYIDMSTIRPDAAARIAAIGKTHNINVLDAPVSGGEAGAVEGVLSIMVGGEAAVFHDASAVFAALGTTIFHVGPSGSGQTVKAANQLIVAGNIAILAEALVFLEANAVDIDASVQVLAGGLAGSTVLSRKVASMISRSFAPGFRMKLFDKDLGIAQAAAHNVGVTTLIGSLAAQLVASSVAQGDGDLDHSGLIRIVDQLSKGDQPKN